MSSSADVLILTALRQEFLVASKLLANTHRQPSVYFHERGRYACANVDVVGMGMGPARADAAARWALETLSPRRVLLAGFAGGLSPDLAVGDLVVADAVTSVNLGAQPIELHPVHVDQRACRIVTTNELVDSAEAKAALFESSQCGAVDMESYAVADVCRSADVRLTILRSISDDYQTAVDPRLAKLIGPNGAVDYLKAAGVLCNPLLVVRAARQAAHVRRAETSLQGALKALLEELASEC